jgi:hypothetical protein
MTEPAAEEADLTPEEQALLASPRRHRGYQPVDDIPEPVTGPTEPVGTARPSPAQEATD